MTEQTKAQRLAERLDLRDYYEFDAGLHCPDAAAELRRLDALNKLYEAALNEIACWKDGEVGCHMDEPGSAQEAREVLKKAKEQNT